MGFPSLTVATAAAVAVALAVLTTPPPASAAAATIRLALSTVLDATAAAGAHTLPDGRQFAATATPVGGCVPPARERLADAAGAVWGSTVLRVGAGGSCRQTPAGGGGEDAGGDDGGGGVAAYAGFMAVKVAANGFHFTPRIDVAALAGGGMGVGVGGRGALTALGRARGVLVLPDVVAPPGGRAAAVDQDVPAAALAAVGWGDLAPAADAAVRVRGLVAAPVSRSGSGGGDSGHGNDAAAAGTVDFPNGIDELLLLVALAPAAGAPADSNGGRTPPPTATLSALTVGGGCACAFGGRVGAPLTLPRGRPGRCVATTAVRAAYGCDFRGRAWCDAAPATAYVRLGAVAADGGVACAPSVATVYTPLSPYVPSGAFERRQWG